MKFAIRFMSVVITISLGAINAQATPTTHIWAPSTDVQAYRLWHVTHDVYLPVTRNLAGVYPATVTNIGLTAGVIPSDRFRLELGFDHKLGLGVNDAWPMYSHAKFGVTEGAIGQYSPALAVGIYDVGTNKDVTTYNIVYAKLAKSFSVDTTSLGRFSVGYFTGNKKLLVDATGADDNHGIFAAWERTMTEISSRLWICVEYMGTKSGYGATSVGGSWNFADGVYLLGGYSFYNEEGYVDTATLQLDIDFRL